MKIILDVDIEKLLSNTKLSDLKRGVYPFPMEYIQAPEVVNLIQKRIKLLEQAIDFKKLLKKSKLGDLKRGKLPFPIEHAKLPEVKKLIQDRIKELEWDAFKFVSQRKEISKIKYWKIIVRQRDYTLVRYVRVDSLLDNDEHGGYFKGCVITFKREYEALKNIHVSKHLTLECTTKVESFQDVFSIYAMVTPNYRGENGTPYWHNGSLVTNEEIPISENEFNDKLEEMSLLIKYEHENIL